VSPRSPSSERRHNHSLREILGELVEHARDVAQRAGTMTPEELEQAQERLEWLADEVWRAAAGSELPPPE
jgi:hypothetical protein